MSCVYITGASGFLGKNIVRILSNKSIKFIAASRNKKYKIKKNIIIGKYENIKPEKSSILLHLAETNDINFINKNGNYYNEAVSLLKKLLLKPWLHVIYISSALVYGVNSKMFHRPNEILKSRDIYTKNKLMCEDLVIKNGGTVLRLTNTYGPGMPKINLFSDIFKQLNNDKIMVKNLNSERDYLWVDDLVEAIIATINIKPNKILNIAYGETLSVTEIINIIFRITNKKKIVQEIDKSKNLNTINLDIELTKKVLKWKPRIPVKKGINLMIKNNFYADS